jgi:tetratricopeptide (TPR) repeat protein
LVSHPDNVRFVPNLFQFFTLTNILNGAVYFCFAKTQCMSIISSGRRFIFLSLIVASSSFSSAQGPVSSAYHNTTARFNAYFYAKQDIMQVEQALWESHEWNYSKILPVYPPFDTLFSQGQEAPLEDCVKKASISIQRHPESKWAYDCYVLVGRARIYSSEFPEAIETFKYVNTKSDNKNERHEALVQLLRAFVEAKEYDNAVAVSDYLKKERLNADNQRTLFLNRADLYQQTDDLSKTVQNLVLAEALIKDADERARINFIIGQIYQNLGFDAEAYRYYKNTLKDSPSYELSFHTKLNMACAKLPCFSSKDPIS